jgi:hypothetical protein
MIPLGNLELGRHPNAVDAYVDGGNPSCDYKFKPKLGSMRSKVVSI